MILKFNSVGKILFIDKEAERFFDLKAEDIKGGEILSVFSKVDTKIIKKIIKNVLRDRYFNKVIEIKNSFEKKFYFNVTATCFKNSDDIQEIVIVGKEISTQDFYPDTNIYREVALKEFLKLHDYEICSATLLIKNFLDIILICGSDKESVVADKVASFIMVNIHSEATLFMVKFNEFVIVSKSMTFKKFENMINELIDSFEDVPFVISNNELYIDIISGIAQDKGFLSYIQSTEALYKAQSSQSKIYKLTKDINKEYEKTSKIVYDLKESLKNSSMIPYYTPIINNYTMKVMHYDTLAQIPEYGNEVIDIDLMLNLIKSIKLSGNLTKEIVSKTLKTLKEKDTTFTIDIKSNDILNEELLDFLKSELLRYNLFNKTILEICSFKKTADIKKLCFIIDKLKKLGMQISVANFDGRYSNYDIVLQTQADFIKIDPMLTSKINDDIISQQMISSTVQFCKKLGIKTIIKNVKTKEVLDKALLLGVDYSSGELFTKELNHKEFLEYNK